jgi:small subunit ribosomal protein S1
MVNNRYLDQDVPVYDDGWWASVLAEEENHIASSAPRSKKAEDPGKPEPDWDRAMAVFKQDEIVTLTVCGFNRGGLLVEGNDLSGFVPCSHLMDLPFQPDESRRDECLATYLGKSLRLKIIECVPEESRIVYSERAARTEAGKRPALFSAIQPGQKVSGDVTNVTDFGVFVDLGGVEGLIHISELSWGRVAHPNQICQLGQRVEVLVMEVAPERCRIALSIKRLQANPWESAQERYPVDAVVPATITALVPFGAFARIEDGLEGLIHASEIACLPNGSTSGNVLSPGQNIQVRILQVDASRQRLGLSMKID